ncbi:MAG TPA: ATP-binding cassette domain-containing protein [Polyangiaceae bacterium]|nr:ATP-binding cassette domain-containing protein [Polyangiaceae bacterium]
MASEALVPNQLAVRLGLQRGQTQPGFRLDVTLELGPGLNVLFGPSGSGKTTILSAIAGLLRPDSGRITLAGETLFDAEAGVDLAPNRRRVALVFQSLALFPHLDALGNVAYGLPGKSSRSERRERAHAWLTRMRAAHLARRYPSSFSGGEAQRVALARALASEPRALLLDEPFSALDHTMVRELSAELVEHVNSLALPVVLVTHDRTLARELGREVTLLRAGRVERVGPASEVLAERE